MVSSEPIVWRGFRRYISAVSWAALVQKGSRRPHYRGEYLLRQGEPGGTVHLLAAGRVKVVYSDCGGDEVLLSIRGPGDLLGELAAGESLARMASVRAIESCVSYVIRGDYFREHLRHNGLSESFERYMNAKMRQTAQYQWRTARTSTESRLAELLLEAQAAGGPEHRAPHVIQLSQEELAKALGASRSSVTSVLRRWRESGVVEAVRGSLAIVSPESLRRLTSPL